MSATNVMIFFILIPLYPTLHLQRDSLMRGSGSPVRRIDPATG
jgi:hypothetical protein